MSEHESAYTFGDGLPLEGVAPGSNLLVTGEAMGRAREVALSLVFAGAAHEEGMAVVSATKSERRVRRQYESVTEQGDRSRLSVIDCTGRGSDSGRGRVISSPGDLTGIAIQISQVFTSMRGDGVSRIRVGVDSLFDVRDVYERPDAVSVSAYAVGADYGDGWTWGVFG